VEKLEPVFVGGVTASMRSTTSIRSAAGSAHQHTIVIERAGEVIPYVVEVI
jgi:NAD-dependent DNA ligase